VITHFHCSFRTKNRRPFITPELRDRLRPFLGAIARQHKMKAVEIGGMPDHVHLLTSLPSTMTISKAMQLLKGGSSKWVHDIFPNQRTFSWQEEYGAFSLSVSQMDNTIAYFRGQLEHHRKFTLQEEFLRLLKKHALEHNDRYLSK
jgi:putative transposase